MTVPSRQGVRRRTDTHILNVARRLAARAVVNDHLRTRHKAQAAVVGCLNAPFALALQVVVRFQFAPFGNIVNYGLRPIPNSVVPRDN